MHIEPGVVVGAKMALGYATAAGVFLYAAKHSLKTIRKDGLAAFGVRALLSSLLVFCFFEVLPHYPVGVSEVHFILGSTLFLIFGAAPAAIGLAMGLLAQGGLLAPADLPQYGMNVTSLLVPLFVIDQLARRIIPADTAYKDVSYGQALKLSTAFQAGVVAWVGFWATYGQGFGAENLAAVAGFSAAYMLVILVEPLIDLAVLAAAKSLHRLENSLLFHSRLYQA
ncbi:MAG: energy-coupling factor ABC transporter permease [Candidatus Thiodiazotropha sp.]|nr:energy-coupling factor ABC transporter permease [Candidatus Thiodiazotropha taylori]MBT3058265.1 energy-coupling factor ABC transporter permease [Candidatus Thiodiazotropha sp. (ex Lucina pensylvanica)]MBT3062902.1 energy-coupling factor ABC transporter permease [Candidatus Thiodiazotropha sp. (ex Lucina pensylvanica)]PUB74421.1 MAG: cobalt transporter [gamma proteobacterium symbiont of Ctena orbiculata]